MASRKGKLLTPEPALERPTRTHEVVLGPRTVLRPGTRFKVSGIRGGVYVFKWADIIGEDYIAVTCYGGPDGHGTWRTFKSDRITKVFRH